MASKIKLTISSVIIDLISLLVVLYLPTFLFRVFHVTPFQRGFYCDDDSIKYPYRDDTVPIWVVMVVGISLPVVFILVAEAWHSSNVPHANSSGYRVTSTCSIPQYVIDTYRVIIAFLFGLGTTNTITDLCKYSVGRLRPCFLDLCRPNVSCDDSVSLYIDNFTCTGSPGFAQHDARLSFLSGHASISYFCAVFFAIYVQARLTWTGSRLLKHVLQVVAIYAAIYVGMSRISDYKHHWSDVLMGALLGSIVAFCANIGVLKLYQLQPVERDVWINGHKVQVAIDRQSLKLVHARQLRFGIDSRIPTHGSVKNPGIRIEFL